MDAPIVELTLNDWGQASSRPEWTAAVEAGKVLYFPRLGFRLRDEEQALLRVGPHELGGNPAGKAADDDPGDEGHGLSSF